MPDLAPSNRHLLTSTDLHIRGLTNRDMPAVLTIENAGFENGWDEYEFKRCLRRKNCYGLVATHNRKVVGFAVLETFSATFQILDIAVHPEYRRQRAGQIIMTWIVGQMLSTHRRRIVMEIRETNLPAQMFLKFCGFRASQVLRAYYDDSGEDCFQFEYLNPNPPTLADKIET